VCSLQTWILSSTSTAFVLPGPDRRTKFFWTTNINYGNNDTGDREHDDGNDDNDNNDNHDDNDDDDNDIDDIDDIEYDDDTNDVRFGSQQGQ